MRLLLTWTTTSHIFLMITFRLLTGILWIGCVTYLTSANLQSEPRNYKFQNSLADSKQGKSKPISPSSKSESGQTFTKSIISNSEREQLNLPNTLTECTDYLISKPTYQKEFLQYVQLHCLDRFISFERQHDWAANFTTEEQNYVSSIFRKLITDYANINRRRHKRDIVSLFPNNLRVRREVRARPYSNWQNYARNVRRLKLQTILPNGKAKWDILADLHTIGVRPAHRGPNFLPWHRLYLLVVETALGVPIPYWESPVDFRMVDPVQTVLFTSKYFGNGFGLVRTGPFANFDTPLGRLFRNIGADGALMDEDDVNLILMQSRLGNISDPTAVEDASIEGQHAGVHLWVDGVMDNIAFSPYDPIFFCHHAFVDFIWEKFRYRQKRMGINPETDTVIAPANLPFQNFTQPSVGFTGYYNSDGYSERIASVVRYAEGLTCPSCGYSEDVYCDRGNNVCVSKVRDPREYAGVRTESMEMAMEHDMLNNGSNSEPFELYQRDLRVRMDSVTLGYTDSNRNMETAIMKHDAVVMSNRIGMNSGYVMRHSEIVQNQRNNRRQGSRHQEMRVHNGMHMNVRNDRNNFNHIMINKAREILPINPWSGNRILNDRIHTHSGRYKAFKGSTY